MKKNLLLKCLAAFCIAVVFISIWKILSIYHSELRPPIDSIFFKWADYGALLAGIFTFAAALFSLATLIYLVSFNLEAQKENRDFIKEQSALISRQMKLSELEQYTKHRELFDERLNHIEKRFEHKFEVADPFQLYNTTFPNNKIGHTDIKYEIEEQKATPANLKNIVEGYQALATQVTGYQNLSPRELSYFPLSLYRLQNHLQLRYDQDTKIPGDIFFKESRIGFNCFKMREGVDELTFVLNRLLDFTGNKPVKTFAHQADTPWTQNGLLEYFTAQHDEQGFHIHDPHKSIASIYRIRKYSEKLRSHSTHSQIYTTCCELTQNKSQLMKFEDINFCNNLGRQFEKILREFACETIQDVNFSNVVSREAGHLKLLR